MAKHIAKVGDVVVVAKVHPADELDRFIGVVGVVVKFYRDWIRVEIIDPVTGQLVLWYVLEVR